MSFCRLYMSVLCVPVSIGMLFGQKEWSLEQCIGYALDNNIYIKQQELNAAYNKNNLFQSKINVLPSVNGYAMYQANYGSTVDPFTSDFTPNNVQSGNLSVSSSVTLFNGLQKYNTIRQNKLNLMASLEDTEKTKNDISLNIASFYLQILFNEELLEIAKNQLNITRQQVERTEKLVEAGSLAQGSLLEIQAQAASEELQVVNADNQLKMSYLNMVQILELDSAESAGFRIEKPVLPEIREQELHLTVEDVFREAMTRLPQIKSAEYQLQSAEIGLGIARGARSPRLSASATWWGSGYSSSFKTYDQNSVTYDTTMIGFASYDIYKLPVYSVMSNYETRDMPFSDQLRENKSTTFSFSINVPVFNGWQVNNAVSNAKIDVLNRKYRLDIARNDLYKEIQQAHADAVAALKKFHATQKAVVSLEEAFRYTQQKYSVGLVNSLDFNLAKNQLTKAESDLLQAKYEYIFKTKILDFYMGNPIRL